MRLCASTWIAAAGVLWLATGAPAGPDPKPDAEVRAATPAADPLRFDGHRVVRVEMQSFRDVRVMQALSSDPWTCGWDGVSPGTVDFRVSPEAFDTLRQSGLTWSTLIEDVQRLVDGEGRAPAGIELRGDAWYDAYQPAAAVSARIDQLVTQSAGRATRISVGSTVLARDIFGIRISSGPGPGGVEKPAIVINGCQHAREWITVMATMHLAERLLNNATVEPRIARLCDAFDWYIVPIVNVDGYEHTWLPGQRMWRKNRRNNGDGTFGIDNNRNWGGPGWGVVGTSTSTNSDVYCGPSAFSEPETRAVRDFLNQRAAGGGVALYMDIHSYGQLILEPVGYDWNLPIDTTAFTQLSALMQEAAYGVAARTYYSGPIYRNIYPVGGGSCDWAYTALDALGMSIELRDTGQNGFVLPASQIRPAAAEMEESVLAAAASLADRPIDISFVDNFPSRVAAAGATPLRVRAVRGLLKPDPTRPVVLKQRIGRMGSFVASNLAAIGSDEAGPVLEAVLTGGPCGSSVQFYFEVPSLTGQIITVPPGGGARPFEVICHGFSSVYSTSFDSAAAASGWLNNDTNASNPDTASAAGRWLRGDPAGATTQAEFDRTPLGGAQCYFTGDNARGQSTPNVDGGKTTLTSPLINLAGATDAEIAFWLWYSNNRGGALDDSFAIDISADGAAVTPVWVRALTIRAEPPIAQATGVWRRYSFKVAPFGALTANARVRFVASDLGSPSVVEAAIDDFSVVALSCAPAPCAGDFDLSGTVSVQDIFDFLAAYFAGDPAADFDASGGSSVQDIFDFLAGYFTPC